MMNLHDDRNAFAILLDHIHERTDIREDLLEKDYYVTLLLHELSTKQHSLPAYFKGGTALYKAIGQMKRFSEDIDLTVEVEDCSKSQAHKRLKDAAHSYESLRRTSDKAKEHDAKGSIVSVYEYVPITEVDLDDSLQRFGNVKVEATSFTKSVPHEPLEITPLVYSEATSKEREALENVYGVKPFRVDTIKIERIFADKVFAAEFYYERHKLDDVAKHLYDLSVMMEEKTILDLLANRGEFTQMLKYKREEEANRIGSDLASKPFSEFKLYPAIDRDNDLVSAFSHMQDTYVFNQADRLQFGDMSRRVKELFGRLLALESTPHQ
jgi:predicted nucleotidyltransferase component of viral defense system